MHDSSMSAIVLAGDRANDALPAAAGVSRKALVPIAGRPMLVHVLQTLQADARIGRIYVAANGVIEIASNPEVSKYVQTSGMTDRVTFCEGATGPALSCHKVLTSHALSGTTLVTTADNALLSNQALRQFIRGCDDNAGSDVMVGLARERDIRRRFPDVMRTYLRFAGEGFSGCNLFALNGLRAAEAAYFWSSLEGARKKPVRLVANFGVRTLFRWMIGRLNLAQAMAEASRVLGLRIGAVLIDDPLAAMDVDTPDHLAIARKLLTVRST